jgi:hypothetical protein
MEKIFRNVCGLAPMSAWLLAAALVFASAPSPLCAQETEEEQSEETQQEEQSSTEEQEEQEEAEAEEEESETQEAEEGEEEAQPEVGVQEEGAAQPEAEEGGIEEIEAPAGEALPEVGELPEAETSGEAPALEEIGQEEAPAPTAAEEPKPQEAPETLPAAEPAAAEAPKPKEGVWIWHDKIHVQGILQVRAVATGSDHSPFPRYTTDDDSGQMLLDLGRAGLAFRSEFTKLWSGYLHLGYSHSFYDEDIANPHYGTRNGLDIYEAYAEVAVPSDYFKQDFYVRMGRIPLFGFPMEYRGQMRSSDWFITPSPISTFLNNIYGTGVDVRYGFEEGKNPLGGWAAGILEGNGFYFLAYDPIVAKHFWPVTDLITAPHGKNDDVRLEPGFYGYATIRDPKYFRAHIGYYHNGVKPSVVHGASLRVGMGGIDINLWGRGQLQFQMLNGEAVFRQKFPILGTPVRIPTLDFDGFYFALHVPFGAKERHRAAVRYDEFTMNYRNKLFRPATSLSYAFDYSFQWRKHHRFGAEYIYIDTQEWVPSGDDYSDDMFSLNYTFSF